MTTQLIKVNCLTFVTSELKQCRPLQSYMQVPFEAHSANSHNWIGFVSNMSQIHTTMEKVNKNLNFRYLNLRYKSEKNAGSNQSSSLTIL